MAASGGHWKSGNFVAAGGATTDGSGSQQNTTLRLGFRVRAEAKKTKGMTLTGNVLSGDTYGPRTYIKKYLGGKWNPATKTWTVDVDKVQQGIKFGSLYSLD